MELMYKFGKAIAGGICAGIAAEVTAIAMNALIADGTVIIEKYHPQPKKVKARGFGRRGR